MKKKFICSSYVIQLYNFSLERFISRSFDTFDEMITYIIDNCIDLTLCKCFARYNDFTFYFDLHLMKNLEV